jgi:hypothetical protein
MKPRICPAFTSSPCCSNKYLSTPSAPQYHCQGKQPCQLSTPGGACDGEHWRRAKRKGGCAHIRDQVAPADPLALHIATPPHQAHLHGKVAFGERDRYGTTLSRTQSKILFTCQSTPWGRAGRQCSRDQRHCQHDLCIWWVTLGAVRKMLLSSSKSSLSMDA